MHGMRTAEAASYSLSLSFELLGEHVSTERNAALESHGREIGTLPSFGFRPGKQRRNQSSYAGAHKPQQSKIGTDGLNSAAVLRTIRAKMQELNNAGKIVARRGALYASDVLHLR